MQTEITLEELINIICECQGFSNKEEITESSRLEKDLGITGDDGWELLNTIETRFDITFTDAVFDLKEDESLFHQEGFNIFSLFKLGFGKPEKIKTITVGQLFVAIQRANDIKTHN